jgi:hypothetical protein
MRQVLRTPALLRHLQALARRNLTFAVFGGRTGVGTQQPDGCPGYRPIDVDDSG